jgi:hypothetical protein
VAKVKKETGVTGERNSRAKSARGKRKGTSSRGKRNGTAKAARTRSGERQASPKRGKAKGGKSVKTVRKRGKKTAAKRAGQRALAMLRGRSVPAPVVRVAVKSLDPLRKCGPKTTVQFLYRVDEQVDGRSTPHLVFFDRHGWYCEHGRSCPAVGHARKFNGQIARVS